MIGVRTLVGLALLTFVIAMILTAGAGDSSNGKPAPVLTGWVNDTVNVLPKPERERLSDLLMNYQKETHHQIAVPTIASLDGESIEAFSLRTARAWGLGLKGRDDGILITLAMKERVVRMELGKRMQNFISNGDAQVIIDAEMTPAFAQGNFSQGLELGLKRLMDEARRFVVTPDVATLNPVWKLVAADHRFERRVQ
jgi:uncharacterized protein